MDIGHRTEYNLLLLLKMEGKVWNWQLQLFRESMILTISGIDYCSQMKIFGAKYGTPSESNAKVESDLNTKGVCSSSKTIDQCRENSRTPFDKATQLLNVAFSTMHFHSRMYG